MVYKQNTYGKEIKDDPDKLLQGFYKIHDHKGEQT